MGWPEAIYYLIFALLAYALAPKPKAPNPATMSDTDIPTADEGVEIPVLFGTRDLSGPNVVWYGDVRTSPVKSGGGKK